MNTFEVSFKRIRIGEHFLAEVTSKKAFAGVQQHVVTQLLTLGELLTTIRASLE